MEKTPEKKKLKLPQQNYSGQIFNQPVIVNGEVLIDPLITIQRKPFFLERYDFDKLTNGNSVFLNLATTLLGAVIGLFINMLSKLIGSKIDPNITFDNWEVYAFLLALGLMIICYIIHYLVPNERRRIIKVIKEHFEKSQYGINK
ncbi:hypothetical protein DHD05_18865 [Arenibacter sp. N53]|uniref:hypothetical protein n=1 Tax=Arenibacter TaxID=178469 RepID=UPI000CD49AAC|nr:MULTISPECIES: hypothetical protein [Arenibacter]MCM4153659.1 hypothetical protein [Arenibacter sp. N53]